MEKLLEKRKKQLEDELESINKVLKTGQFEGVNDSVKNSYYDKMVDDFYSNDHFPDLEVGLSENEKKTLEYFSDERE